MAKGSVHTPVAYVWTKESLMGSVLRDTDCVSLGQIGVTLCDTALGSTALQFILICCDY